MTNMQKRLREETNVEPSVWEMVYGKDSGGFTTWEDAYIDLGWSLEGHTARYADE